MVVDDAVAAAERAVFGGVAHRKVHIVVAALIHQVHNHLQFVQALEVGDFLGVARLHQRLESGVDQGGYAAAEDGLLAEQVAFGFVFDGGFQHAGAGAADALGVGQPQVFGVAGGVLMHRQQRGDADALHEQLAHPVAGGFGRHHHHIHIVGQHDFAVMDAEAVRHHKGAARLEVGGNLLAVDAALDMVGNDHHHHIGLLRHGGHIGHPQPGGLGLGDAGTARIQPHDHILPVVFQVQGVGVALAAVADDADGLAGQVSQVGVLVVIDIHHLRFILSVRLGWPGVAGLL